MLLKTGFGYYIKNGKKISKFHFLPGDHQDPPAGIEYVEVNSKEDLDRIVLDKTQEQLEADTLAAQKNYHRNSAFLKLKGLGLRQEEIDALVG